MFYRNTDIINTDIHKHKWQNSRNKNYKSAEKHIKAIKNYK